MTDMTHLLGSIVPEMILGIGGCICLMLGLCCWEIPRKLTPLFALVTLAVALVALCWSAGPASADAEAMLNWVQADLAYFVKQAVLWLGMLLVLVAATVPGRLNVTRDIEAPGAKFEPAFAIRGEFFAFMLFSLAGVMLCAGSTDLAWLFLALELTSLPTYLLVSLGRDKLDAQEAGVKYFFLGALAVAVMLYGFTLIYGVTGTTRLFPSSIDPSAVSIFGAIQDMLAEPGGKLPPLLIAGFAMTILGLSFKIAAFPMHFYAADVYEGANVGVTTFLAFVPKVAGFVSLIVILLTLGWPLPTPIIAMLWIMAVLTMTIGNTLALLQNNLKRVLAYSSVAHSGYMLIGIMAGPGKALGTDGGQALHNGLAGVLFYLVAYGFATIAAFAAIGSLESKSDESTTYKSLSGMIWRNPMLAFVILVSMLSLIGLPPLVGFSGKLYLFGPALGYNSGPFVSIVVIALINSAIAAVYYLRIMGACFVGEPDPEVKPKADLIFRQFAALIAAVCVIIFGFPGGVGMLTDATLHAIDVDAVYAPEVFVETVQTSTPMIESAGQSAKVELIEADSITQ